MAALSKRFWENKLDKLWATWDEIYDRRFDLPIKEYRKYSNMADQAALISMMLETMDYEINKSKGETKDGR